MKFVKIILLVALNISYLIKSLYLTKNQINLINKLIQNKNTNSYQRNKINNILFDAYEKFSIKKAIEFKNNYKLKCKNINNDELFLACRFGLFKAIKKYNAKGSFTKYSSIYINYELLNLIRERYSINIIPKSYRAKHQLYKYKNLYNVRLASSYEDYEKNTLFINDENIIYIINNKNLHQEKISNLLDNLTPSLRRILYLKYFNNPNKYMSNKKISILMGCSEETIRKQINEIKKIANKTYLL
jgi:RNA polymerase sigma factor (sigma-70 family)